MYQHLQTQMADQQAARAAKNKRDKGDRENVELFIDRQRQAAVVLGERDLAGDVKAKRRRDRSKYLTSIIIRNCDPSEPREMRRQ